jgi:hypothetical protein
MAVRSQPRTPVSLPVNTVQRRFCLNPESKLAHNAASLNYRYLERALTESSSGVLCHSLVISTTQRKRKRIKEVMASQRFQTISADRGRARCGYAHSRRLQ